MRTILTIATIASLVLLISIQEAAGRGFGGFRAGGYGGVHYGGFGGAHYGGYGVRYGGYGGYRGYSGYRYTPQVYHAPVYHAPVYSGYRGGVQAGVVRGPRGFEAAGVRAGGARTGGVGRLPTDFGVGHIGAVSVGYRGAIGHRTAFVPNNLVAARGVAVRNNFYHYNLFNPGWYGRYPYAWRPAAWYGAGLWAGLAWGGMLGWFGWPVALEPIYFDYGNTIVYQGDTVYINNQPGPSAAQYYQQAQTLAESNAAADKKTDEYNSLGVFALVQGEQGDASEVFQLAVNKAGIIHGNYQNVLTSTVLPVRGAVAEKTQRAAWTVGDNKDVVYDTGIYNLTKDEAPVLIHFGKERTQQWMLVRLKDTDQKAAALEKAVQEKKEAPKLLPVTLMVHVPAGAEVWLNGTRTKSTGPLREFVSPPLEAGWKYSYEVRARWTENGKAVERTRALRVQPGQKLDVDLRKDKDK